MGRDEIRPREAVAVEEHDIIASRRADRSVADFASAEVAMLVPHMREGHTHLGLVSLDQRCSGRSRAIVRYDDLEVSVFLTPKRAKYRLKRIFAVVRGDDDGDQSAHRFRPFSQAFM
jgi:hypothetical protein